MCQLRTIFKEDEVMSEEIIGILIALGIGSFLLGFLWAKVSKLERNMKKILSEYEGRIWPL